MSIINRALKLATLPITTGSRYAVAAGKAAIMQTPGSQAALEASSALIVEKITNTLANARGPAMKFGQTLAMVSVALPEEQAKMLEPLTRLYENATARKWEEVHPTVKHIEHLVVINPEAIAAASLGQVHEGTLKDGTKVAVKIQYKDAKTAVKLDGLQLKALAPMLTLLAPNLDAGGIVKEHVQRLEDELDYRKEAVWLEKFREGWAGIIDIPKVVYVDEKVLVTEWVEGESLQQIAQNETEENRNKLATHILNLAFLSPKKVGATHADPHPGNYRVQKNGNLGLIDFGAVATDSGAFTELLCDTLICVNINKNNLEKAEEAKIELKKRWVESKMATEDITPEELLKVLDSRTDLLNGKVRLNSEWLQQAGSSWSNPLQALDKINKLKFPPEYLLEHRALGGALALACALDAEVDMKDSIVKGASDKIVNKFIKDIKTSEATAIKDIS